MSGTNRLVNSKAAIEKASESTLASMLRNANEVAKKQKKVEPKKRAK